MTTPNSAKDTAGALRPMPDFVDGKRRPILRRGRHLVGALALGGAFAFFGMQDSASAATGSSTTTTKYTIVKGDTLSGIAARFGVTVASLVNTNGIANQHMITAGKTLTIPVKTAGKTTGSATAPKSVEVAASGTPSVTSVGPNSAGQALPDALAGTPRAALNQSFVNAARKYGVSAELLKSLCYQESGWNNNKVSAAGAVGVGQLMPDTIAFVNGNLVSTPLDPGVASQNIEMSAAFMKYLLRQTGGDETMAVGAYYQGLGAMKSRGMFQDTKVYISNVQAIRARWF